MVNEFHSKALLLSHSVKIKYFSLETLEMRVSKYFCINIWRLRFKNNLMNLRTSSCLKIPFAYDGDLHNIFLS